MVGTIVRLASIVVLLVVTLGAVACGPRATERAELTVTGMHCESCSAAITDALLKIDGVETASADHLAGSASAVFSPSKVDPHRLASEIEGLGYTVTAVTIVPVEG